MRDIWRNIAVHDERAADRLPRTLFAKSERVSNHPEMGSAQSGIAGNVRLIIEGIATPSTNPRHMARGLGDRACATWSRLSAEGRL